jgi:hypothetical protein
MNHTNYCDLDFPQIPEELVNHTIRFAEQQFNEINAEDRINAGNFKLQVDVQPFIDKIYSDEAFKNNLGITHNDGLKQNPDAARIVFISADDQLQEWCNSNIEENCVVNLLYIHSGTRFLPHIDPLRSRAYNYIIETSEHVRNCFWEPKQEYSDLNITPMTYIDYDRLDLVDEVTFPKYRWYELNVGKIHSVENIDPTTRRIIITISYKQ